MLALYLSGLLLRISLIFYAHFHDSKFDVKFTDIDYRVFQNASRYVADGLSPYDESEYRYTPIVAYLVLPSLVWDDFGKFLFITFDLIAANLIHSVLTSPTKQKYRNRVREAKLAVGLWLFNPITAVVSARGNADAMVCSAVLATLLLVIKGKYILAALIHGALAIQLRIYPIIYIPSCFIYLMYGRDAQKRPSLKQLILGIFWPARSDGWIYLAITLLSAGLTFLINYQIFGTAFLNQSLLYHLSRIDSQHNFSPYFYPLRLALDSEYNEFWFRFIGIAAFLPQVLSVIYLAIHYAASDLPACWFLTTFAFISLNKVCTSQYFLWYLCLLPLMMSKLIPDGNFNMAPRRNLVLSVISWMGAQALWLAFAYLYEFRKIEAVLPIVWLCSMAFLHVNLGILVWFCHLTWLDEVNSSKKVG